MSRRSICQEEGSSRFVDHRPPKLHFLADTSQVFLACASIDFAALLDQTSLAASLSIIGRSLDASNQTSWISGAYFVYVLRLEHTLSTVTYSSDAAHQHPSNSCTGGSQTSGHERSSCLSALQYSLSDPWHPHSLRMLSNSSCSAHSPVSAVEG